VTDYNEIDLIVAYYALISYYNSWMSLWQSHAIGELVETIGTDAGVAIEFPFPLISYLSAHEIEQLSDFGTHTPFPSEVNLFGHQDDLVIVTGASLALNFGAHPSCLTV